MTASFVCRRFGLGRKSGLGRDQAMAAAQLPWGCSAAALTLNVGLPALMCEPDDSSWTLVPSVRPAILDAVRRLHGALGFDPLSGAAAGSDPAELPDLADHKRRRSRECAPHGLGSAGDRKTGSDVNHLSNDARGGSQ